MFASYDREEKAARRRRISSLASYVLISQEERSGAVDLAAIGCSLAVEEVYRNPLAG